MSRQLVKDHAARLVRPGLSVRCVDVGETVIVVLEPFSPTNGAAFTPAVLEALAFIVPVTYPDASPDESGFYVKPASIKLAANPASPADPASTSVATLLDEAWRKFSWKSKTFPWDQAVDTLDTHVATIDRRFDKGT
jgi:hypothetical protein